MEKKYICKDCDWELSAKQKRAKIRASEHRHKLGHQVDLVEVKEGGMGSAAQLSILKSNELVPPELALREIGWGDDMPIDGRYQKGVRDGIGLLLVGARMVQVLTAMQADILKTQLEIFREAKGESETIERATQAAAGLTGKEIAEQLSPKFDQLGRMLSPNPMLSMFANVMEPFFKQALERTLRAFIPMVPQQPSSQQQPGIPPGFTLEELKEE